LTIQFSGDGHNKQTNGCSADADIYDIVDKALNLPSGQSSKQPKATLLELGADSLGLAKIVSTVKRTLGHQLDMATMFSFPSVETVVNMASKSSEDQISKDGDSTKPATFSLLPSSGRSLDTFCRQAGVQVGDVEDALPLSASQKAYLDTFVGDHKDTELFWQMNRYKIAKGTDPKRLLGALETLQKHEESLRWVITEDAKGGLMALQMRPGVDSCVERLRCDSEEEATEIMDSRLASCKHRAGVRTATIYLIEIGQELEMTFIESHLFTEGQGRTQVLYVLNQAYNNEPLERYASYSSFTERFPVGHDSPADMEFWRNEISAAEFSEGSDWDVKGKVLKNPADFSNDRLEALDTERSVEAPFSKLTVQMGMSIPFIVESVYALSLALYFAQQDEAFARGSVVYDRCISLRTAEPRFSSVRAVTAGYHPNFIPLDLAKSSLW
jgi:acyl carrier protein